MSKEEKVEAVLARMKDVLDQYLPLVEKLDQEPSDELREQLSRAKEQINNRYWELLFQRLGALLDGEPGKNLAFSDEDQTLFNYGWIDERCFPRAKLVSCAEADGGAPSVLHLTEWLRNEDRTYLETEARDKVRRGVKVASDELARLEARFGELARERDLILAGLAQDRRDIIGKLLVSLEDARVCAFGSERIKQSRSLTKDEVSGYAQALARVKQIPPTLDGLIATLEQPVQETLGRLSAESLEALKRCLVLRDVLRALQAEMQRAEERLKVLLFERRAQLEERLKEIKEDMKICSRWGKSDFYAVLFDDREINSKSAILEALHAIEDFDPGLFRNRKVERSGLPSIVITPGSGNGSYDYRTNTLIVPVTSPFALLESVAYAVALYRRDVDKECNGAQLWESFFNAKLWAKIKDREMPRRFFTQMTEFVHTYILWVTKEAQGLRVLDAVLRGWFEENIAPDRKSPLVPRELRKVGLSEREAAIASLEGQPAGAARDYGLGVLRFHAREFEAALAHFRAVCAAEATHARAHWALGVAHMLGDSDLKAHRVESLLKLRLEQRLETARDHFQQFLENASQSWWSVKAQEYLRKINDQMQQIRGR